MFFLLFLIKIMYNKIIKSLKEKGENMKLGYTNEDLIRLIQEKAKELGRTPVFTEVSHSYTISKRFGTWNAALIAAGLKPSRDTGLFKKGTRFGMLTIVNYKTINNRTYYECKCDCGNTTIVRADSFKKDNYTESCGCLTKTTQFKGIDIIGQRFGKLTITGYLKNGRYMANCDCGNTLEVTKKQLLKGKKGRKSCGCLSDAVNKVNVKKAQEQLKATDLIDGTSISKISRKKPIKSNKSGYTGVSWDKSRKKWVAQIWFKNTHYHLGRYEKKEDAIKAREIAKERLHMEFLKELKEINNK